ncbi:DUF1491 family protein [Novosphingopyxis iocasae]|uniref:DUF1491 family protein n=1 Tax=Novosphingopyxis iocasae TaxID=2762729 RepID=UPI001650EFD6|nr:DUF1491 family protein [Novosphingopyxis iocasae]
MSEPRVAAKVQVDAIRRLCEREGGFAMVLSRGDPVAGDILIISRIRGGSPALIRRALRWDGPPSWRDTETQLFENEEKLTVFLDQKRAVDRDLWLIDLDIPDSERFIALLHDFV